MTVNRRRFHRTAIALPACVTGRDGLRVPLTILNLSRGGVLLAGDSRLKHCLYRRKGSYTHKPFLTELEILLPDTATARPIAGRGAYLRRLDANHFQVGFSFRQVQTAAWLSAMVRLAALESPQDVEVA